jgi:hypothetical protein
LIFFPRYYYNNICVFSQLGVIHNCQLFSKVCKKHTFPDPPTPLKKCTSTIFKCPELSITSVFDFALCKTHASGEGVNKSTILVYAFFLLSRFFSCPQSSVLFYCCFACISFVRLNIKRNQTPMWYLIPGIWKWLMYTFWGVWGGLEKCAFCTSMRFAHFRKWLTIMDDPLIPFLPKRKSQNYGWLLVLLICLELFILSFHKLS